MRRRKLKNNIILASKSPRRKEILEQVGIDFDIIVSEEEEVITSTEPNKVVLELSMQKAEDVYRRIKANSFNNIHVDEEEKYIIIAADTVVAVDDKIMGKPKDREDAYNMINTIQGKQHQVLTGVTLIVCDAVNNPRKISFYESTAVEVYNMTKEEIDSYLDRNIFKKTQGKHSIFDRKDKPDSDKGYHYEWEDKAGAYAVQGLFASYVKKLDGDYYNVVGLPVARIIRELKNLNINLLT